MTFLPFIPILYMDLLQGMQSYSKLRKSMQQRNCPKQSYWISNKSIAQYEVCVLNYHVPLDP